MNDRTTRLVLLFVLSHISTCCHVNGFVHFLPSLACLGGFTVLVMPIAKHWADKVSFSAKDYTIQLIPWKTFHLLQRFFLYMTFFDAYFKGVIDKPIALFTYAFMASIWIWAVMLAVYIMDAWMDQRLGESHVQSTNDQLVSGLTDFGCFSFIAVYRIIFYDETVGL